MRSFRFRFLALILAAAATAAVGSGCALFPEEEEVLPPPLMDFDEADYVTYNPERRTLENVVAGNASVEAQVSVNVAFRSSAGTFMRSYFELGDEVKAGDVLCETDNSALEEELYVAELQAEIDELKFAAAEENYEAGRLDEIGWKQAQLAIYLSRRNIGALRAKFEETQIVAPIDGRVTYVNNVGQGASVTPGVTMFVISDMSNLVIRYTGKGYGDIPVNAEVDMTYVSGETAIPFTATAISTPETVPADSPDRYAVILKPNGLPAEATIGSKLDLHYVIERSENALCVRTASIKSVGERRYVYVLRDGYRQEADIVIGLASDYYTEVLNGVTENDRVIQ